MLYICITERKHVTHIEHVHEEWEKKKGADSDNDIKIYEI